MESLAATIPLSGCATVSITANCIRCMISCGCNSPLIGAESFLDRQGRYMARGRCACCGRAVEQYVTVSVYEALR